MGLRSDAGGSGSVQDSSPRAAKVALSRDGRRLAYLQTDAGMAPANQRGPLTEIWIGSAETSAPPVRVFTLPQLQTNWMPGSASAANVEQVHDLTWTPDGHHLLVTLQL